MNTLLRLTSIIACIIVFAACQKDLSYENFTGVTPSNGNGGATTSGDCKACAYYPICDGSYYSYTDTTMGVVSSFTDTTHYLKDTTIAGVTFSKLYYPVLQQTGYVNCTDGATRLITYNANSQGGATLAKIDLTLIKANLSVGATWQDQLTNPAGQTVIYKYSIVSKGGSRVVNGKTFNNVIHLSIENGVNVAGVGYVVAGTQDAYYAQGVGEIEVISQVQGLGVYMHRILTNYFIP